MALHSYFVFIPFFKEYLNNYSTNKRYICTQFKSAWLFKHGIMELINSDIITSWGFVCVLLTNQNQICEIFRFTPLKNYTSILTMSLIGWNIDTSFVLTNRQVVLEVLRLCKCWLVTPAEWWQMVEDIRGSSNQRSWMKQPVRLWERATRGYGMVTIAWLWR